MAKLPACLADPISAAVPRPQGYRPTFYEIIASRKAGGMQVSSYQIIAWSASPPVRCIVTADGYAELIEQQFRICVLREFD